MTLKAPFPYPGGKSPVAGLIWQYLGKTAHYIEPFCGSAAVWLASPYDDIVVTLNDMDGLIVNCYRAIQAAPDEVAKWVDWPVSELDLTARHIWLVERKAGLQNRLESDPDYYDAKIAGWWLWGACAWIGTGWCSGTGPWGLVDGVMVNLQKAGADGEGVNPRDKPGVNRQLPRLGSAGVGVKRQLPHLGDAGRGINASRGQDLSAYMQAISAKIRPARLTCGDWRRVLTPAVTYKGLGYPVGIFLDPPYGAEATRDPKIYNNDSLTVAGDVRQWCLENGNNPKLRIALAGYDVEHTDLEAHGWTKVRWKARGGMSSGNDDNQNRHRECLWFSPYCEHQVLVGRSYNGHTRLDDLPMFAEAE